MKDKVPPKHIALLAEKYLDGTITENELQEFNDWYNQFNDEELVLPHQPAYEQETMRARLLAGIRAQSGEASSPGVVRLALRRYKWIAAAAVTAIVLGTGYYLLRAPAAAPVVALGQTVKTVNGQTGKLILPDGSIVWLKPHSTIRYAGEYGSRERRVILEGEALFEVAKQAGKPFFVVTGNYTTQVLGTSFNLKHYPEQDAFELAVFTGKVQVQKKQATGLLQQAVVTTRQKLIDSALQFRVVPMLGSEPANLWKNTEYDMAFRNTPLTEIIQRLEKKFAVSIDAGNRELFAGCRLTADLTDQSLEQSLELIAASTNLQYERRQGSIHLYGKGCD